MKSSIETNVVGAATDKVDGRQLVAPWVVGHEEGVEQLRVAPKLHPLECAHQAAFEDGPWIEAIDAEVRWLAHD